MGTAIIRDVPNDYPGGRDAWLSNFLADRERSLDPAAQLPQVFWEIVRYQDRVRELGLSNTSEHAQEVTRLHWLASLWREAFDQGRHREAQCWAFAVGQQMASVRSLEFEPAVKSARHMARGHRRGHEERYGTDDEKRAREQLCKREYDRLKANNPTMSERKLYEAVSGLVPLEGPRKSPPSWQTVRDRILHPKFV